MTALPYLDSPTLHSLLSWPVAVQALADALRAGLDPAKSMARSVLRAGAGELLLMPAESPEAVGVKILGIAPENPTAGLPRIQGLYLLLDAATLTPKMLIDGAALTSLRTPAVSALAISRLAAPDAAVLTVFGTGPQAAAHVHAIGSIRALSAVRIIGRDPDRTLGLVDALRAAGVPAGIGTAHSLRDSDIVLCATTASTPLFHGDQLPARACVVAIGSHQSTLRELDDDVFRRASTVVVEDKATALREAGDVIMAVAAGALAAQDLLGLAEILDESGVPGISVFKSVGMGWQDLAVAQAAQTAWAAASTPGGAH
ncbi:ornithine cyclodeaminase [Nakamurella panacisegetis]|uniref:Ornithine cyclodeaminase n=1 Tax=Nakamurella panacisegetis TaxID=1090615 RepID=A0A1H0S6N9_9ACTN|nr:ornithine cyclodeaminase family protein [Nakamurella panacisegetis]SDP37432.1 ornithine cyclodeaminase [Nakamurella panacisegetis]